MRLILLGAPGAGKGTQAEILTTELNLPHISTGDMFRESISKGTDIGMAAKEYMDKGKLVPDEITIGIVKQRLKEDDCKDGFILDGFPRTIAQAEYLDETLNSLGIKIDKVINIAVANDEIIGRMSGRRVCTNCGMTYHINFNPPDQENKCIKCGNFVIQREDDKEETVIKRLEVYENQTKPLIEYYDKKGILTNVEGKGLIEETKKEVMRVIGELKK